MINLKRVASVLGFAVASSVATTAYASSISANFSPDTIGPGSMSVLTLTFNNTGTSERGFDYSSTLPSGVVVADPSILSNSCGNSTLTATAGANSFSLMGGEISAASSCAISLWVESAVVAAHVYTPDTITIGGITTSPTADTLTVDSGRPGVGLSFSPSSAFDGDDVALTITFDNTLNGGNESLQNYKSISLPSGIVIANNANPVTDCPSTIISSIPGDTQLTYQSSGSVSAGSTCSISQNVKTVAGEYVVSDTSFTNGSFQSIGGAAAKLNVLRNALSVQSPGPVVPGGTNTLDFTITNFSRSDSVADVDLTFDLSAMPGVDWSVSSTTGVCNSGTLTGNGTDTLTLSNGSLAPEEVCRFTIDVNVPPSTTPGTYAFSSTNFEFDNVAAGAAVTDFVVIGAPTWTITPNESSVLSGDSITLTFEATDTSNSPVSNMYLQWHFPDELQFPTSIPSSACGGTLSTGSFGSPSKFGAQLSLGSLSAGGSCSFDITFNVNAGLNSTLLSSQLLNAYSTVGGQTVFSSLARFDLSIYAAPKLAFDMPTGLKPGDSGTVGVTIEHSNLTNIPTAESIAFSVDLSDFSSDISSSLTSISACGGTFANTAGVLSLSGGELLPGETCSFSFPVTVGANAQSSTQTANTQISAEYSASTVTGQSQQISLLVSGLDFSMAFEEGMLPGQTNNLVYMFVNNSAVNAIANLDFEHDLIIPTLPDLTPNDIATVNTCGGTFDVNAISGEVSFNDADKGSLAAGETCTITVPVTVAPGTSEGVYTYSTSALSFDEGTTTNIIGSPASDNLVISSPLSVTKVISKNVLLDSEFLDITYTFTNNSTSVPLTNIAFTEDFASYLSGIGIASYTAPDCAFSDSNSGGLLDLSNGSLGVNESCELTVQLSFPTVSGQVFIPAKSSDYSVVIGGATLTYPGIQTNFTVVEDGQEIVTTLSAPSSSATNNSSVTYTVTFSNADSVNLLDNLVQLNTTGTASATTAVTGGTTNTATVTLSNVSGDGTLGITILAGAARNGLGNSIESQPSATFVVDNTAPVISFSSTEDGTTVNSPITLTIDLSAETDTMTLTQADLVVVNATVQAFSLSNGDAAANITVTPVSDGAVSVTLPANTLQDAVGNNNTAQSISATYDGTPPALNITSDEQVVNSNFLVTFTFSEAVIGFASGDINVVNGSLSGFNAISTSVYQATINPQNDGDVVISVASGSASDDAGNTSTADSLNVTFDTTSPSVSITANDSIFNTSFTATIEFNESVVGFTQSDITATNASLSGFSGSGPSYSVLVEPISDGDVALDISSGSATDDAGNENLAASQLVVDYDGTRPTVFISAQSTQQTTLYEITIEFSEPVSGFDITDISTTNASVSDFSGDGQSFSASLQISSIEAATAQVNSDVASDEAGNFNTSSNVLTLSNEADLEGPKVIRLVPSNNEEGVSIDSEFSVQFDEPIKLGAGTVTLFENGNNTALASLVESELISSSDTIQFNFGSLLELGKEYSIRISEGIVQDAVGNKSSAITNWSFITSSTAAPIANNDVANTDEDLSISINFIENDTVADGELDTSSVEFTQPTNGSVTNLGNGVVRYTPKANFNGTDRFEYSIADKKGQRSNLAQVDITVNAVNDAPEFTSEASVNAVVLNRYEYVIKVNDVDSEQLTLSATKLPGWLTLEDFTLSGIPELTDIDKSNIVELVINDGQLESKQSFTITISEKAESALKIVQSVETNNIIQQQAFVLNVNITNATDVEANIASLTIEITGANIDTLPSGCQVESTLISCTPDAVLTNSQDLSYQLGLTAQPVLEFVSAVTLVTTDEQSLSNQLALPISEEVDDGTGESLDGAKSVAFTDLNNDGFADFIFISDRTLMFALNDGKGGFDESTQLLSEVDINAIELVDIDNDGLMDIAFAGSANFGSGFILNLGGLSFAEPTILTNKAMSTLRVGDFAGSGEFGLLFISSDGSNYEVFTPPFGSESLQRIATLKTASKVTVKISDIQVADFNLDGVSDILIGYEQGNAVLFESVGEDYQERTLGISDVKEFFITNIDSDEYFDIVASTVQGIQLLTDLNAEAASLTNVTLTSLQVADVLGLGSVQIIGLTTLNQIAFVKQTDSGYQLHNRNIDTDNASFVRVIDIDKDGDTDLVYGSEFGSQVIYNQGEGEFGKQTTDLVLSSNVDKTTVEQEDSLVWTIELSNQGFAQAENAVITLKVNNGQIDVVNTEQLQCNSEGESESRCTLSNFATDSSANLSVTVKATTVGEMTLASAISSDRIDDNEANNQAELSVNVNEKAVVEPPVTEDKKSSSGSMWLLCLLGGILLPIRRKLHF